MKLFASDSNASELQKSVAAVNDIRARRDGLKVAVQRQCERLGPARAELAAAEARAADAEADAAVKNEPGSTTAAWKTVRSARETVAGIESGLAVLEGRLVSAETEARTALLAYGRAREDWAQSRLERFHAEYTKAAEEFRRSIWRGLVMAEVLDLRLYGLRAMRLLDPAHESVDALSLDAPQVWENEAGGYWREQSLWEVDADLRKLREELLQAQGGDELAREARLLLAEVERSSTPNYSTVPATATDPVNTTPPAKRMEQAQNAISAAVAKFWPMSR